MGWLPGNDRDAPDVDVAEGESRAEQWGIVADDGSIDIGSFAASIFFGFVSLVVLSVSETWLTVSAAAGRIFDAFLGAVLDAIVEYWQIFVDIVDAAGDETVRWFDLFGPAAFPLAVAVVVALFAIIYLTITQL